jgi:CheY-like chemotaxis protein
LETQKINNEKPAWQILVVDDEPAVSNTIKLLLEHDGHNVQTANSGREALVLLEQGRFDLVTTDFSMSGMKGDTLAAAIKERLPNQPILMISTNGAIAKASGDPLPGVDLVISKPFHLEDLRKAMAKLLHFPRLSDSHIPQSAIQPPTHL